MKNATATKPVWTNPDTFIVFDVKDVRGVRWTGEAGGPSARCALGPKQGSVSPSDRIAVDIYKSKIGRSLGRSNKIVPADSSELRDRALGYLDTGN